MNPIIIENLRKSYGTTTAVNGVSFEVNPGEIFGLIGPDGAGKTTIIRTVVSLLEPDEGSVMFKGSTHLSSGQILVTCHSDSACIVI